MSETSAASLAGKLPPEIAGVTQSEGIRALVVP
jgi:hypothetical protein